MRHAHNFALTIVLALLSACGGGSGGSANADNQGSDSSNQIGLEVKPGVVRLLPLDATNTAVFDPNMGTVVIQGLHRLEAGEVIYAAERFLTVTSSTQTQTTTVVQASETSLRSVLSNPTMDNIPPPNLQKTSLTLDSSFIEAVRQIASESDVTPSQSFERKAALANSSNSTISVPISSFCDLLSSVATVECRVDFINRSNPTRTAVNIFIKFTTSKVELKFGVEPVVQRIVVDEAIDHLIDTPVTLSIPIAEWGKKASSFSALFRSLPRFDIPFSFGYVRVTVRLEPELSGAQLRDGITFDFSATGHVDFNNLSNTTVNDFSFAPKVAGLEVALKQSYASDASASGSLLEISGKAGIGIFVTSDIFILPKIPGLSELLETKTRIGGAVLKISPAMPFQVGVCSWGQFEPGGTQYAAYGRVDRASVNWSMEIDIFKSPRASRTGPLLDASNAEPVWKLQKVDQCRRATSTILTAPVAAVFTIVGGQISTSANVQGLPNIEGKPISGQIEFRLLTTAVCKAEISASGNAICTFIAPQPGSYPLNAFYVGSDDYKPSSSSSMAIEVSEQANLADFRLEFADVQASSAATCTTLLNYSPVAWSSLYADFDLCTKGLEPAVRCIGAGCTANRFFVAATSYTASYRFQDVPFPGSSGVCSTWPDETIDLVAQNRTSLTYPGAGWYRVGQEFSNIYPSAPGYVLLTGFPLSWKKNITNIVFTPQYAGPWNAVCALTGHNYRLNVSVYDSIQKTYTSYSMNLATP